MTVLGIAVFLIGLVIAARSEQLESEAGHTAGFWIMMIGTAVLGLHLVEAI